jgi:DNA polymerase
MTPDERTLAQDAKTSLLLGVDYLPIARRAASTTTEVQAEVEVKAPAAAAPSKVAERANGDKRSLLDDLKRRHDEQCAHCTSAPPFTQTVFGDGDPDAALMFIGEAPGAEEDKTGVPFVGRAGEKLNDMIRAMGLAREEVYIANILKARPPNNATPTPDESAKCGVWLKEQIRIIRPRVIVTLGKPAANYMLENREAMGAMRGTWHEYRDEDLSIPLMPTFHPAYLLRAYTPENRKKVWSDLQMALARIND